MEWEPYSSQVTKKQKTKKQKMHVSQKYPHIHRPQHT